jgi:predicted 2-oxoglutarate/Fe(II)-dependent dioxygenase YbiX
MLKNFIYYEYLYNEQQINELRKLCETSNWIRVGDALEHDHNKRDANTGKTNRFYSSCDIVLDTHLLIETYLNFLPEFCARSLDLGFNKSGGYYPDVKLSRYDSGDFYGWHCDCWETNSNVVGWKRQLSSITYLNDDYEGGETEFECGVIIKPTAGKTVIFPSSWLFPHQGNPVNNGTKYIYVNHIWT